MKDIYLASLPICNICNINIAKYDMPFPKSWAYVCEVCCSEPNEFQDKVGFKLHLRVQQPVQDIVVEIDLAYGEEAAICPSCQFVTSIESDFESTYLCQCGVKIQVRREL